MAKLIEVAPGSREYELGDVDSIGSAPGSSIRISDRLVSREHATIRRLSDGRYLLRDLRTLNGTFVREERVDEQVLHDGDVIELGTTKLRFVSGGTTLVDLRGPSPDAERIDREGRELVPARTAEERLEIIAAFERLSVSTQIPTLLQTFVGACRQLVHASFAALYVAQADGALLPLYVSTDDRMARPVAGIVEEVRATQQPTLCEDANLLPRWGDMHDVIMQGVLSILALPLVEEDRVLGVLYVHTTARPRMILPAISATDRDQCAAMARRATFALMMEQMERQAVAERQARDAGARFTVAAGLDPAKVRRLEEIFHVHTGRHAKPPPAGSLLAGAEAVALTLCPVERVALAARLLDSVAGDSLIEAEGMMIKALEADIAALERDLEH